MKHSSNHDQDFVHALVCKKKDIKELRQRVVNVFFVVKNFILTGIGLNDVVPVSVQTDYAQPTKVYNLTLESENVYYANGILVSNCLTFAMPVLNKSQKQFNKLSGNISEREYDPLERKQTSPVTSYDPLSPLAQPITGSWKDAMTNNK